MVNKKVIHFIKIFKLQIKILIKLKEIARKHKIIKIFKHKVYVCKSVLNKNKIIINNTVKFHLQKKTN